MRSTVFLIALISFNALAAEFPDGWRLPMAKELAGDPLRDASPSRYARIESDFNHDGVIDYVYLLKSTLYPGEGLLVKLSTSTGFEWQLLDRVEWGEEFADAPLIMRIELAKPGDYKTACALGYWQCGPDEPAVLKLKRASIKQDRFDGAKAIWYWDERSTALKKVWLGD